MKKRKRFETMKKLLEVKDASWGVQFRPKQQGGSCVENDEKLMPSPHLNISNLKHSHLSPTALPKKSKKSRSCKRKMAKMHDLYGQVEAISSVMEQAQAVQASLDTKFPSFVKPMIRSNVTKGFWLSLPKLFCKLHLPVNDARITLEDENQDEYSTKYLAERRGLSGGWRGFSIAHNLVEALQKLFKVSCNYLLRFCKHFSEFSLCFIAAGLISETFSIANAVKVCKINALPNDSAMWNKRLISYEQLQNNLCQVNAQMDQLVCLVLKSNEASYSESSRGVVTENQGRYTSNLQVKMLELKDAIVRLYAEIEVLKINAEMHKLTI